MFTERRARLRAPSLHRPWTRTLTHHLIPTLDRTWTLLQLQSALAPAWRPWWRGIRLVRERTFRWRDLAATAANLDLTVQHKKEEFVGHRQGEGRAHALANSVLKRGEQAKRQLQKVKESGAGPVTPGEGGKEVEEEDKKRQENARGEQEANKTRMRSMPEDRLSCC